MISLENTISNFTKKYHNNLEYHSTNYDNEVNQKMKELNKQQDKEKFNILHQGFIKVDNPEDALKKLKELKLPVRFYKTKKYYDNGFIKQSFQNNKKNTSRVYSKKEIEEIFNNYSINSNLVRDSKGYKKRVIYCYENLNDKNSLYIYVVIVKVKTKIEEI